MLIELTSPAAEAAPLNDGPDQSSTYRWLFWLVVGSLCVWVLSLPAFPSQDGGMHLYYVRALREVLRHNPLFLSLYDLRSLPPPYTMQYVMLGLISSAVSFAWAEKIAVCLTIILSAAGFRFAAEPLGRNYAIFSLWAAPVFLSWPLFMGFHSYCLSLAFCLWAWGFWSRASQRAWVGYSVLFCLCAGMITLTHPVPLLYLGAICGLDLCRQIYNGYAERPSGGSIFGAVKTAAAMLGWLVLCLAYIKLFVEPPPLRTQAIPSLSYWQRCEEVFKLHYLFAERSLGGLLLHRLCLVGAIGLTAYLAGRNWPSRMRTRRVLPADVALILGVGVCLMLPFLPKDINGLRYFSERMQILIPLFFFAAAAHYRVQSNWAQGLMAYGGLALSALTLIVLNRDIRPVAERLSIADQVPVRAFKSALIFPPNWRESLDPVNFDVTNLPWSAGRYLARVGAVVVNDPFTDPPNILPLRHKETKQWKEITPWDRLLAPNLYWRLMKSEQLRERVLPQTDALIFAGRPLMGRGLDPLVMLDAKRGWHCSENAMFTLCLKAGN